MMLSPSYASAGVGGSKPLFDFAVSATFGEAKIATGLFAKFYGTRYNTITVRVVLLHTLRGLMYSCLSMPK